MATIETSIFIKRSAEDIFNFAAYEAERIPEWFEGIEALELDENYPEIGSQLRLTYKAAGLTLQTTGTVEEFVSAKKYVARYEGMASGVQSWTYEPEDGGTQVTVHFDYEMSGGGLGKIVDKLIVERTNNSNFKKSLVNLKTLLEK